MRKLILLTFDIPARLLSGCFRFQLRFAPDYRSIVFVRLLEIVQLLLKETLMRSSKLNLIYLVCACKEDIRVLN